MKRDRQKDLSSVGTEYNKFMYGGGLFNGHLADHVITLQMLHLLWLFFYLFVLIFPISF